MSPQKGVGNKNCDVIAAAIMVRTSLLWIAVTATLLEFTNVPSCLSTAILDTFNSKNEFRTSFMVGCTKQAVLAIAVRF